MGYQFRDSCALSRGKVKLHVRCIFLEFLKQGLFWCPKDVMNFVDLVKFVVPREKGEQGNDFKHYAANAPQVHLIAIVTVS